MFKNRPARSVGAQKQRSLEVAGFSDRGKVRQDNQDRIAHFSSHLGEVVIVADGMGGHKGGALAAEMAVAGFREQLESLIDSTDPESCLREAARRTNNEILGKARSGEQGTAGMGTTVVIGIVRDREVLIGHAGDSRAYLLQGGRLSRLTRDHSVVQRMVDSNMLTEEEARVHPQSNVITRALGQTPDFELEITGPVSLNSGDGILLCSDGLSGYADDTKIEASLAGAGGAAEEAVQALGKLAADSGSDDNVSIQFIRVAADRPRRLPSMWMLASALAITAAVLVAAFLYVSRHYTHTSAPSGAPAHQSTPKR